MKKVISIISLIAFVLVALTGCVTVNYNVTINADGSGEVSYVYAFDKGLLESMGMTIEEMVGEMQAQAEETGYLIEIYSEDTYEGFRASKYLEDITEFSLEEAFGEDYITDSEENKLKITKSASDTIYSQNAEMDLTTMEDLREYGGVLTYSITLPVKAGSHNADEVSSDGKTLTWELYGGEIKSIEFEASSNGKTSSSNDKEELAKPETKRSNNKDKEEKGTLEKLFEENKTLAIGIGAGIAGLVVIFVIVLIVAISSKKKSKKNQPVTEVKPEPKPQPEAEPKPKNVEKTEGIIEDEKEAEVEEEKTEEDEEDKDKK